MDRFDDLARAQHRFQRAKNEFFDCDIPRTGLLRSVRRALSADNADTQSAAGSAWLSEPPIVPRLRIAR
jgi:hypothetical protein